MYQILEHSRDDDSYMYSYSSFTFHVCSKDFGDEMCSFSGSHDGDSSGWRKSGVQEVRIDGNFAVGTHENGREERVELPVKLELQEGMLVCTYADGRVQARERNEALAFSKYGQPYSLKELKK
jgi:hypothetical protein